jgi:hypothetical protein
MHCNVFPFNELMHAMKLKLLFPSVLLAILSAASLTATGAEPRIDLLGEPAPDSSASRTIVINPDTTSVHVTGGDIVKFIAGDKTFTWNFDGPLSVTRVRLNRVAPAGVFDHEVSAYVSPNPMYLGPP